MIIKWPRHLKSHCPPTDDPESLCARGVCVFCGPGALYRCARCGAVEDERATECPGRLLEPPERAAVRNGHLDYVGGGWMVTSALGGLTPAEVRDLEWYQP